jgi:hypothetical protein
MNFPGIAAPAPPSKPAPVPAGPVRAALAMAERGGELWATLTFTNVSSQPVWLERIEEGQAPPRSEFEIRSEGRPVPYTGPTSHDAHRLPRTRDAFFALEPGKTWQRELRIDDRYTFPEGARDYTAAHSYLVWNPRTRQAGLRTLKLVKFKYASRATAP